jgi:hypothetical protein
MTKKQESFSITLTFRFTAEMVQSIDAEIARRQKAQPWSLVSRQGLVREAIWKLLNEPGGTTPLEEE